MPLQPNGALQRTSRKRPAAEPCDRRAQGATRSQARDMTDPAQKSTGEFQEIGHCGGQFTVNVKTGQDGHRGIQLGIRNSRPTPASWFAVYALPQGIPVGTIQLGGIGDPCNPAPFSGCFPIFIASDSHGMFGHQCLSCAGYWRSGGAASRWRMTCPYCGVRGEAHEFLTDGQVKYLEACCELIAEAMNSESEGERVVDMDEVADAVGKDVSKPKFYYAEEQQQNKYTCVACGEINDILGRYGYCSNCGTHNGVAELEADIKQIRNRINNTTEYEACTKDAVAAFDGFARHIAKQLSSRVPMTPARRREWGRKLFHNLKACAEGLSAVFDINPLKSLTGDDIAFATLMFHRRHVYEHNGGEVDEKYIRDSGDTSVRPKQVIRETRETASRIADLVGKMGRNIADGLHQIFAPEQIPLRIQRERADQMAT